MVKQKNGVKTTGENKGVFMKELKSFHTKTI